MSGAAACCFTVAAMGVDHVRQPECQCARTADDHLDRDGAAVGGERQNHKHRWRHVYEDERPLPRDQRRWVVLHASTSGLAHVEFTSCHGRRPLEGSLITPRHTIGHAALGGRVV